MQSIKVDRRDSSVEQVAKDPQRYQQSVHEQAKRNASAVAKRRASTRRSFWRVLVGQ